MERGHVDGEERWWAVTKGDEREEVEEDNDAYGTTTLRNVIGECVPL